MSKKLALGWLLALGLMAAEPAVARARKPAAPPPAEPSIQVVSADDEAEKANPGLYRRQAAPPLKAAQHDQFRAALDDVFGEGRWRQTSGYRTVAQENALRRAGAGTVKPGRISRHSIGGRETPGAYDVVVSGMSTAQAAAKLKAADQGWGRVAAEAAHGREGAHLHLELASEDPAGGR